MEDVTFTNGMNEAGYDYIVKAREMIRNGEFYGAMDLLTELKRNKQQVARTAILKMLCGYKAGTTSDLLTRNSNSVMKLQKIAEDSDWQTVRDGLSPDYQEYVDDIIEYCAIAIRLSDDTDRIKTASPSQRPSAFAQMDAEEEHNMARERATGETDAYEDTTAIENLLSDYERHMDNVNRYSSDYHSYRPAHPDDRISKTIDQDITGVVFRKNNSAHEETSEKKLFGRRKNAETESEKPAFTGSCEELLSKNINTKPKSALEKALEDLKFQGRNDFELKSRQDDLIARIDQLEARILPN